MKINRNAPCPCGSGKKYKRCCLTRDQAAAKPQFQDAPPPPAVGLTLPGGIGNASPTVNSEASVPRYVMARMFEDSPESSRLRRRDPGQWTLRTISGVASLTTEAIQKRLSEMGVDVTRESFRESAADRRSAWELSKEWLLGKPRRSNSSTNKDFAGLASCELWKRFCPEQPSMEMLDDWMQEGYQLDMKGNFREACDTWSKVWEALLSRLTSDMRTTNQAEPLINGSQALFNWTQDFALSLINASIEDRAYAERGVLYLRELLRQFPDEDGLYRLNAHCDLGELLFRAGQREEGEQVFKEIIAEHPDQAIGYARLAHELANIDPPRALALLEEACGRPVKDREDWDLTQRLEDLRSRIEG